MYKIAAIGDRDTVISFKVLGIDVYSIENFENDELISQKIKATVDNLASNGYGIIFITEEYAQKSVEVIERYKNEVLPIITLIPNNKGSLNIGMNKIKRYILNLKDYLIQSLKKLNKEYKRPIIRMITRDMCAVCSNLSLGIVSFNVEGIESIEIAQILSDNNIYVRENNDCMNIQKQFIRVSLGIYNTKQDIDIFIQTLKKIIDYYL